MYNSNNISAIRALVASLLVLIVLPICAIKYNHRGNAFAATTPKSSATINRLTNIYALQNWLPDSVIDFMLQRVNSYLGAQDIAGGTIFVLGDKVSVADDGSFLFSLQQLPRDRTYDIVVKTNNNKGVLSSSVYINGKLQTYTPVSHSGDVSLRGFSSLTDVGVSAVQVSELQQSLIGFDPSAQIIAVKAGSVEPTGTTTTGDFTMTFDVSIGGATYQARITYIGLTDIHIFLSGSTGKQVFDSGKLDTSTSP